jgi:DNA modification methylase
MRIERCIVLWSNEGENVFTPFMGVGSEVYAAIINNRNGIGVELKPSYYNQTIKNCEDAFIKKPIQRGVFDE